MKKFVSGLKSAIYSKDVPFEVLSSINPISSSALSTHVNSTEKWVVKVTVRSVGASGAVGIAGVIPLASI